jgi:hypothetical protein
MAISFDDLWNQCEELNKNTSANQPLDGVLNELELKVNLYKTLCEKIPPNAEELAGIKSRAMGEILFTLTKLSLRENINVYAALVDAAQSRSK